MSEQLNPLGSLEAAIVRGGFPSLISSRQYTQYKGRPGEIIEKMSPEHRVQLQKLTSEDVSERKVSRLTAWLGFDHHSSPISRIQRTLKLQYDREVLHLT